MKLSKEKRNQLILVLFCTVAALALIWLNLIRPRYAVLHKTAAAQKKADEKLTNIQNAVKNAATINAQLSEETQTLSNAESDMASGDLYSWTYNTIRRFKAPYAVDIQDIGHPDVGAMDLLPAFPFKQVTFTLSGTAYYHDLGKFIADLENKFPHVRVVNLQLQPANVSGGSEKLSFRMNVILLVKSMSS